MFGVSPIFCLEKVNKKLVDIHDHPCLITLEVVATSGVAFG